MTYFRAGPEPATTRKDTTHTEVGSVFVSNYPPYSFWSAAALPQVEEVLQRPPEQGNRPGLYLHIPFCRRRCKFCYFRVYTGRKSAEIQSYLEALASEVELYGEKPRLAGGALRFVYFGGGTPSYLSARQLKGLAARLRAALSWEGVEEVAFECEPGTLTQAKVEAIKEIGVTRLSLGLENLDDEILRRNGRAHLSREIYRAVPWIKERAFEQVNVDLIAGMAGETWERWRQTVQKTIDLDPDSITTYQLELPYNTVFSRSLLEEGSPEPALADWETKRAWHAYAFEEFEAAGYAASSAYTVVKKDRGCRFVYRDALWEGGDMIGAGVASIGHFGGVHCQNEANWEGYLGALRNGRLPLGRAFAPDAEERLVREMILQLKRGAIEAAYFRAKFGVDPVKHFGPAFEKLRGEGMLDFDESRVELRRQGLLQVDQLLPEFYAPRYRNARYT